MRQRRAMLRCRDSFPHFAKTYCRILSETGGEGTWTPFALWPRQEDVASDMQAHRLLIILKARQLGMTWLALAYVLWLVLFHPIATVLLFSRRDDEAVDLLKVRLRGMAKRLPEWMQAPATVDNDHEWQLANGSRVLAFPTTAGDSYTATLAVVDEADLVPDLGRLMGAVKPTIDGGGRMILLSRPDKTKPESTFKRIYRAARQGLTDWHPVFLPWHARPDRDKAWHEAQAADVLHRTGSLDDLHEQYPETDAEAMAPRTQDKRLPAAWLTACYVEQTGNLNGPAITGLSVFRLPTPQGRYVIGADPAEGNPCSDDSAAEVLDTGNGEQVASLAGKFEPDVFAQHINALSLCYNRAPAMVERNNHGHAVIMRLKQLGVRLLAGRDGKDGWVSSQLSKVMLYDSLADALRNGEVLIHHLTTFAQLASIEGSTLKAPESQHDDRAMAFALAVAGRLKAKPVMYRKT